MDTIENFLEKVETGIDSGHFVKLTLSKPSIKSQELQNVYFRLIELKNVQKLSATYRNQTNDQVKNFEIKEGLEEIIVKTGHKRERDSKNCKTYYKKS